MAEEAVIGGGEGENDDMMLLVVVVAGVEAFWALMDVIVGDDLRSFGAECVSWRRVLENKPKS